MTQNWTLPLQLRVTLGVPVLATPGNRFKVGKPSDRNELAREGVETAGPSAIPHIDKFTPSSLTANSFHYGTALSLALAARLAYENKEDVEETVTQLWRLNNCEFVDADGTQCFIATTPEAVIVAFRGTKELGDWLANLNVLSTTRTYGTVHRGFLGAFQVVEKKLDALMTPYNGRPIVITGHSLGGALALIAAAEWHGKRDVSWVHTCGQPAVGKRDFQGFIEKHYGDTYFRFVNDDDVVPMVPPFYRHAGRLIHFGEDDGVVRTLDSSELESLGIDLGPVMEEPPMLTPEQFNLMRAQLLQESVQQGSGSISDATIENAAQGAVLATGQEGVESLEGLFPSVSDHSMDTYVKKIARETGV
jgi:hypothetical protein